VSGLWYCVTWDKTHRTRVRHGGQAIARLPPEHLAEPLALIMEKRRISSILTVPLLAINVIVAIGVLSLLTVFLVIEFSLLLMMFLFFSIAMFNFLLFVGGMVKAKTVHMTEDGLEFKDDGTDLKISFNQITDYGPTLFGKLSPVFVKCEWNGIEKEVIFFPRVSDGLFIWPIFTHPILGTLKEEITSANNR